MDRLKQLAQSWSSDRCTRKAAALAYYTVFSLAPLLVIVVALASLFVPDQLVAADVANQAKLLLGQGGAAIVGQLLRNARAEHSAGLAALIATGVFLLGATSAFGELKSSLDDIWQVPSSRGAFWAAVRSKLLSFALVLSLAVLLMASLVLNAALGMFSTYFAAHLGGNSTAFLHSASFAGSFLLITLLFATIYKLLPEVSLSWKDVALSSLVTALLFMLGHVLLARFLGNSAAVSVYGGASSLAVLLLWVYYSTMIFFFGAEITKVWRSPGALRRNGRRTDSDFRTPLGARS